MTACGRTVIKMRMPPPEQVGPLGVPNPLQAKALWHIFGEQQRVVSVVGGWGGGKTQLIMQIMQMWAETCPGVDGMIVGVRLDDLLPLQVLAMGGGGGGGILRALGWRYLNAGAGGIQRARYVSPPYAGQTTTFYISHFQLPKGAAAGQNPLEGPNLGIVICDEVNRHRDSRVLTAALGRVRAGRHPCVVLLGKPTFDQWWLREAIDRGGVGFRAPSRLNRPFLPDYDGWVSAMTEEERAENLDCIPQQREGAVFSSWRTEPWPRGNLTPPGWTPDRIRARGVYVTMDFGVQRPAALLIGFDPELGPDGAWVVFGEAQPNGVGTVGLCRAVLRGMPALGVPPLWPVHRSDAPPGALLITRVIGDKAGRARGSAGQDVGGDALLASDFRDVAESPHNGGLGFTIRYGVDTAAGERADRVAGIKVVRRLICAGEAPNQSRRLLCWDRLWRWGESQPSGVRTFARCVTGYLWAGGGSDRPAKDGETDHAMDALRYWAVCTEWPTQVPLAGIATHRPPPQRPVGLMHGRDR